MGTATWRPIAITHGTGSTGKAYVRIGSTTTVTSATVSSSTPAGICLRGRDSSDATEGFDGETEQVRIWSSEFSQAQVEAEWASPTPVITSGGYANRPLANATDLTDTIASRVLTTPNGTGQTTGCPPCLFQEPLMPEHELDSTTQDVDQVVNSDLVITATASATHPEGTVLDEHGNPVTPQGDPS